MGVVPKWHFSTSVGAVNLGDVSGDLSEHRGSGIPLLGITSIFMHKLARLITVLMGSFMFINAMVNVFRLIYGL